MWTDKIPDDFDYEYTILDEMPDGWRNAFGLQMMEELRAGLLEGGEKYLEEYRIEQVKEKFGSLRWYSNFDTKGTSVVVRKYEEISERTCIHCGKPATWISQGWICPFCDDCIGDKDRAWPIEEYYSFQEREDTPEEAAVKAAADAVGIRLDVIK